MARMDDLDALLGLAALSGGGITCRMTATPFTTGWPGANVARRRHRHPEDEFYMLALEDGAGRVIGTASIFSRIGVRWPFYSYKVARVTHVSRGLDRMFSTNVLHLVNDFDGATEVAGLFLHPDARTGGGRDAGAQPLSLHRPAPRPFRRSGGGRTARMDGGQTSPFWEAVAGPSSAAACWRRICSTPCMATSSSPTSCRAPIPSTLDAARGCARGDRPPA
jgi:arginine N-succinyltransferase